MSENIPKFGILSVPFLKNLLRSQLHILSQVQNADFKALTSLSLEHMGLVKINCLWPLSNLVQLNLAGNLICCIENLDSLKNLEQLSLSFNKIIKLENLESLRKLEKLSLYSNYIEKLEGLDSCTELSLLNVGKNNICENNFPFYLAEFKKLRCLVVDENPCYAEPKSRVDIDECLLALMPRLLDLNNRKISVSIRSLAIRSYRQKTNGFRTGFGSVKKTTKLLPQKKFHTECFNRFFSQNSSLLKLSEECEIFHYVNSKFQHKATELFEQIGGVLEKFQSYIEAFRKMYTDLRNKAESDLASFTQSISEVQVDELGSQVQRDMIGIECEAQAEVDELFDRIKGELKIKSSMLITAVKEIGDKVKAEIISYSETVFRNIAGQKFKNETSAIFVDYFSKCDVSNEKNAFRKHCFAVVDDLNIFAVGNAIKSGQSKIQVLEEENLRKHRNAIAQILEYVQSTKKRMRSVLERPFEC